MCCDVMIHYSGLLGDIRASWIFVRVYLIKSFSQSLDKKGVATVEIAIKCLKGFSVKNNIMINI